MEWPLAVCALLFLILFSADVLEQPRGTLDTVITWAMITTYAVFVVDYAIRLYLAQPRLKWFLRHVTDLAIIALPALRPLRLLSLAVVIRFMQRAIGHTIRGRVIVYTTFGSVIIVYAGALAMLDAERNHNENITNFGDALWWSFTTVTTVGYGDTYPVTAMGRIVAVALMIAGVSLLGVVTATLASWIVERVAEEDSAAKAASAAQLEELRDEVRKLAEAVKASAYGGPKEDRGPEANQRVT